MASTLQHDSHPQHPLVSITDISIRASCRACDLPFTSGKDTYGCRSCGFFLHRNCCLLETSLPSHPAHPQHPLRLLCTPANSGDPYQCNICGNGGKGFRYHCQTCGHYNAHVRCTSLPQQQRIRAHPKHPLQLLYPPLAAGRTCCSGCGHPIQHACYGCSGCSFFLHPKCLKKNPMIGSSSYQQPPTAAGVTYQQAPTAAAVTYQQAPARRPPPNWTYLGLNFVSNVVGGILGDEGSHIFGGDGYEGDEALEDDDVQDWDDDCEDDMVIFDDEIDELPGFDGYVDDPIEAEGIALAFEHMERMG